MILTWTGAKDLQDITQDADRVILFGITCGLSAPYVAGQIDYSMYQVCYSIGIRSYYMLCFWTAKLHNCPGGI